MNLYIQHANNKFNNSLYHTKIENISVIPFNPRSILYKAHYSNPFTHIIFIESLLDAEIIQFIAEFFQSIKIFIYHDKEPNLDIIRDYKIAASHLVNNKYQIKDTITLPNLINDQLFFNKNIPKNEDIVCFLEYQKSLSSDIQQILYPNTKHKIKLFNSPNIEHVQNLGVISEIDKASILQSSGYYIPLKEEYLAEAVVCGCVILNTPDLQPRLIDKDLISSYSTYSTFIKELINV
jgi:hypothetical protein